jgi:hypothetical protein
VETFHHAIRLGVVCCRQNVLNPQLLAQRSPNCTGELRASVRCDEGRDAEAGDAAADVGVHTGLSRGGDHWDGLNPPGRPVYDGEEV